MEHYLTNIYIEKLRHLQDINIGLNEDERKHLLITGKNGSGKTTLLYSISKYLMAINEGKLNDVKNTYKRQIDFSKRAYQLAKNDQEKYEAQNNIQRWESFLKKYCDGLELSFSKYDDLDKVYKDGEFVIAYFPADRKTNIVKSQGVENIKLKKHYRINEDPGAVLLKYMVHLKTQQSYARNENDINNMNRIQHWFDRFENALKILLADETIRLEYNYKDYDFFIIEQGKEPFGFDQLSDGYSSVINIVSDLILRMDKDWLLSDSLSNYDMEGIVLIDELETHLHIDLQKKILPFLTHFFPRIQFIVTTHSPYILNSISNAKAYDLEKHIELENTSMYSSEDLAEAYFDTDEFSEIVKNKIQQYRELALKEDVTEDERAIRADLRLEFKQLSGQLSEEIKSAFEDIERQRTIHG